LWDGCDAIICRVTTLVRPDQPEDDLDRLRARIAELEALLDARAADADRIERELDIAEAELGELSKHVAGGRAATDFTPPPSMAAPDAAPRFTSDAVRKLFRDVARTIHPDLARDEHTRDRRHSLMIQANRAYAMRDEEQLRRILDAWERSPEAVQGSDPAATRLRLERRLAQIEEHLETCTRDLSALQASRLHELKTMVDEAASGGRDLVADMVRRLKRDIMAATNRLDAMRSSP